MKKTLIAVLIGTTLLSAGCANNSNSEIASTAATTESDKTAETNPETEPEDDLPFAVSAFNHVISSMEENNGEDYNYETRQDSMDFITQYPNLFPVDDENSLLDFTDTSIEMKHLKKNASSYGDKLIYDTDMIVLSITEDEYEGQIMSTIYLSDSNKSTYYIMCYIGRIDIFEDDVVRIYGLPLGHTTGELYDAEIIAGSYIEKIGTRNLTTGLIEYLDGSTNINNYIADDSGHIIGDNITTPETAPTDVTSGLVPGEYYNSYVECTMYIEYYSDTGMTICNLVDSWGNTTLLTEGYAEGNIHYFFDGEDESAYEITDMGNGVLNMYADLGSLDGDYVLVSDYSNAG